MPLPFAELKTQLQYQLCSVEHHTCKTRTHQDADSIQVHTYSHHNLNDSAKQIELESTKQLN